MYSPPERSCQRSKRLMKYSNSIADDAAVRESHDAVVRDEAAAGEDLGLVLGQNEIATRAVEAEHRRQEPLGALVAADEAVKALDRVIEVSRRRRERPNQLINTNVLWYWRELQPQATLIAMGTSCAYPPELEMSEEHYLVGEPDPDLYTYAMTKRMLYQGLWALQEQFGMSYRYLVPSTL